MKRIGFSVFFHFVSVCSLLGQFRCEETLDAGEDWLLCSPGVMIQLQATFSGKTDNILDVHCSPSTGISDTTILWPELLVTGSQGYRIRLRHFSDSNLIFNGDFELGNLGFSSEYTFSPNNILEEGLYTITSNPRDHHPRFSPCQNQTPGGEKIMAVNGANNPNVKVWCQTVEVLPHTHYVFTAKATSLHRNSPALLQFSANGDLLGDLFRLSPITCQWNRFYALWYSGDFDVAEFCIINQNTVLGGNDFALDDIFLSEVCIYEDSIYIHIRDQTITQLEMLICDGDSVLIGGESYKDPGTYEIILQDSLGCDSTVMLLLERVSLEAKIDEASTITCNNPTIVLNGRNSYGSTPIDYWFWRTSNGSITTDPYADSIIVELAGHYELVVGIFADSLLCLDSTVIIIESDTEHPHFHILSPVYLPCQGSTLLLELINLGRPSDYAFKWHTAQGRILDGATTENPLIGHHGLYYYEVTDLLNGCITIDSVMVHLADLLQLNIDLIGPTCTSTNGKIVFLSGEGGTPPYVYHLLGDIYVPGDEVLIGPGRYEILLSDQNNCKIDTLLEVISIDPLYTHHLDTIKIPYGEKELIVLNFSRPIEEIAEVRWIPSFGIQQGADLSEWILNPKEDTEYMIYAMTHDECQSISRLIVFVIQEDKIFMPDAFTPRDRNGINDRFFPMESDRDVKIVRKLEIFDRWGGKLFISENFPVNDGRYGWDGSYRGQWVQPGEYIWRLEIELLTGQILLLHGLVHVM